jgi:BirA family biotin operon repressor/biotin-[acetyl-CoA-carboxylase] ligase
MDEHALKISLAGLPIPHIRYFDVIGSTNDEALAWLSKDASAGGAEDGCLVVADRQYSGRGRLDRHWVTRPGSSLAFSLILRPSPAEVERLAYFSPLGALAICQALESLGLAPLIKWPNDVLLKRRKAAGILVEVAWLGNQLQGIVVGIGLNVATASVPPTDQLLFPAISVEEAAGQPVERSDLLQAILTNIFAWRARLFDPSFLQGWEQRLAFRGEWVRLEETGREALTGQVIGIDSNGSLLLHAQSGEIEVVTVGDVHLRPIDAST